MFKVGDKQSAQNQNRLHAAHGSTSTPAALFRDLKRSVASLEFRIHKLRREAMTLVRQDDLLRKRFELLVSIPGIAQVSAMQLLAELSTLPPDLTVREWVAHRCLDPAHEISFEYGFSFVYAPLCPTGRILAVFPPSLGSD